MGNSMPTPQFNQQLEGPQDINEAIQLLAAKGQTDPMIMQSVQIVVGTLNAMSEQAQSLVVNLQFNGFAIQKLIEKAQAGEIDENFDLKAFVEEIKDEFQQLLDASDESTDSDETPDA